MRTRRLLATGVEEVRVLSRDELEQDDMRRERADWEVRFHLRGVRDYASMERATRRWTRCSTVRSC